MFFLLLLIIPIFYFVHKNKSEKKNQKIINFY